MINIGQDIAAEIAGIAGTTLKKLGLRFDKVVVRLLKSLNDSLGQHIPNEKTVVLTITAPIKLPAKTESELKRQILDYIDSGYLTKDRALVIYENNICMRMVDKPSRKTNKMLGFVHNRSVSSTQLLDLVTNWLYNQE